MVCSRILGPTFRRHARRRSSIGLAVASCVAALLASCQAVPPTRPTVVLLPDTSAQGQAWNWTAACPFGSTAATACHRAGPLLGSAQLAGDEWNLGGGRSTAGSVRMSVNSAGALALRGDLPSAPPCTQSTCVAPSAYTWVRGYPSVLYGIDQCNAHTSPPVSRPLRLPLHLSSMKSDLVGTTSYSSETSHITYDIAYDMWLNNSATKKPCRTDGTVEVMVWTDYDQKALLPPSLIVGTADVPFAVDGVAHPGTRAFTIYASNIDQAGHTVPWGGTLWFVLDQADIVSRGTVSVDLSAVLSAAGSLLQNNYRWSTFARNYWLDTIPFGMEYGPQDGSLTGAGSSRFSLNLSSYCLGTRVTVAVGAC
ncbi:MAG TPA: hypothetical protein VID75_10225 [Acidimicrobiales bacterium]|jgi:hypothetical protein